MYRCHIYMVPLFGALQSADASTQQDFTAIYFIQVSVCLLEKIAVTASIAMVHAKEFQLGFQCSEH